MLIGVLSLMGCTAESPKPKVVSTVDSSVLITNQLNEGLVKEDVNLTQQKMEEVKEDVNLTQQKMEEVKLLFKSAKQLSDDGNHTKALNKCEEALQKIEKEDTANLKKANTCIEKEKQSIQEMLEAEKNAKISKMFDAANKLNNSKKFLKALSKYDEIIQLSRDNKDIVKKAFIAKKNIIDIIDIEHSKRAKFYFEYAIHTSSYEYFKKSGDLYYHYTDMMNQVERNNTLNSYLKFYEFIQNDDEVLYRLGYLYTISKNWVEAKRFISESKRLGNYDAKELWLNEKLYSK